MTTTTTTKRIKYDRHTNDWHAYLDGEYIGSYKSPRAAENELDRLASQQARNAARIAALDVLARAV